jgi:hypothetical protein
MKTVVVPLNCRRTDARPASFTWHRRITTAKGRAMKDDSIAARSKATFDLNKTTIFYASREDQRLANCLYVPPGFQAESEPCELVVTMHGTRVSPLSRRIRAVRPLEEPHHLVPDANVRGVTRPERLESLRRSFEAAGGRRETGNRSRCLARHAPCGCVAVRREGRVNSISKGYLMKRENRTAGQRTVGLYPSISSALS